MAPVPARKIKVLLDRLNALLQRANEQPIDELEWQRLRQEARPLLATDPQEARMALGILAALRGDEATAMQEFEAARTLGWTSAWALNRATMLARFHRMEDALNEVMTVVKQGPGSGYQPALREAAEWAYAIGRLHLAADLLKAFRQHHPEPLPPDLIDLEDSLARFVPVAEALELTDDLMAEMQAPAWALIREQGFRRMVAITDAAHNDGDAFLSRAFRVPLPFEAAYRLDLRLVEEYADSEADWPIERFVVSLRAQEPA